MSPYVFEQYNWSGLANLQRYLGMTVFVIICLLIDCNNFFYKYLIWVPPNHVLLKYRIFLWGFAAVATSKEWYEFVSDPNNHRLGPFAWLSFYVSLIELSGIVKFAGTEFNTPLPTWIYYMWSVIFGFWLLGLYRAY